MAGGGTLRAPGQAAMVALAPSPVHQVHNECWPESPLVWIAHIVGREATARSGLKRVTAQVSAAR